MAGVTTVKDAQSQQIMFDGTDYLLASSAHATEGNRGTPRVDLRRVSDEVEPACEISTQAVDYVKVRDW